MSTRFWYGKSIQTTQKVMAAFFNFMELESAQIFLADIITHADAPKKYQPEDAANHMMKYYALSDLLAACYNLLKDEAHSCSS